MDGWDLRKGTRTVRVWGMRDPVWGSSMLIEARDLTPYCIHPTLSMVFVLNLLT